jgi:hypothetical protein
MTSTSHIPSCFGVRDRRTGYRGRKLLRVALFVSLFCLRTPAGLAQSQPSNVWQFSVPLESGTERRAYLWIPPDCLYVRGVLVGLQNMLERPMFEDSKIRQAVAESNMAIVWISPGGWPGKAQQPIQPSLSFDPPKDAITGLQTALALLAKQSGYAEVENAPLLVTGHSAAGPFVWGMATELPDRVFAALPYKNSIYKQYTPVGVPTLYVSQEWAEWGDHWGETWHREFATSQELRKREPRAMLGDFADIGAGHFDFNHASANVLALFIRKAAQARLPTAIAGPGPVHLKPLGIESGVLVDADSLGTDHYKAVPYGARKGDRSRAFWYFDTEMADAVNSTMTAGLKKKPQAIDFVVDGKAAPLIQNGFVAIKPVFLADGVTFRVHAESLDKSPTPNLYGGGPLGHASTAITYRVSSGDLEQVGSDTFRVTARSGGFLRQGMPWEPWIQAVQPGDAAYRSTDRPAHILIDSRNTKGVPQTLLFSQPGDVARSTTQVKLQATASSGLPVQFFVESGPATMDGDTLHLLTPPARSRYPIRVMVSAFQWGRAGEQPVQTAGPETREFLVNR